MLFLKLNTGTCRVFEHINVFGHNTRFQTIFPHKTLFRYFEQSLFLQTLAHEREQLLRKNTYCSLSHATSFAHFTQTYLSK